MKNKSSIDIEKLRISHDPVVIRHSGPSKYDEVFRKVGMNQCIVCEPDWSDKLSQAFRSYLKRESKPGRVKATRQYTDGKGRVWLLPEVRKKA